MSLKNKLSGTLMLAMSACALNASAATAETIMVQTQPTVIMRTAPVVTAPTRYFTRYVVPAAPLNTVHYLTTPTIVRSEPVTTTTTTTSSTTLVQSPIVTKELTNSVLISPLMSGPNFRRRLQLLDQQISLGASRGMLGAGAAANLQSRVASLASLESSLTADGQLSKMENDSLELQINVLNQDVSHAMGM